VDAAHSFAFHFKGAQLAVPLGMQYRAILDFFTVASAIGLPLAARVAWRLERWSRGAEDQPSNFLDKLSRNDPLNASLRQESDTRVCKFAQPFGISEVLYVTMVPPESLKSSSTRVARVHDLLFSRGV
jgi:hypothetical protein